MQHRYTESAKSQEFVTRKRRPSMLHIVLAYGLSLAAIAALMASLDNAAAHWPQLLTILGIVTALTAFTALTQQRSHDLVMATEFQNTLFANAASVHSRFCLITKQDGTVIYYDPGFQQLFPDFLRSELRAIDVLLKQGEVGADDSARIYEALQKGTYEKLVMNVRASDGRVVKIMLNIDPLPRPQGFYLFRGREFVERRDSASAGAGSLSWQSLPEAIRNLFDNLPVGIYAVEGKGKVQFVNEVLAGWLGYKARDMASGSHTVQNFVEHMAHLSDGDPAASDYEGEVQLRRTDGSTLRARLVQRVQRDARGNLQGCTGIVMNLE